MKNNFEYDPEREIYAISRIIGAERIVDVLNGMTDLEVTKVTQIASQTQAPTLSRDEASFYMSKFLDRVKRLGVYDSINADAIQNQLSKKKRFSSGKFVNASLDGFEQLSEKDPEDIKSIIQDETIYVKAVILSNIDYGVSERVISLYPLSEKVVILKQMDECENTDIAFLESLSETLVAEMKRLKSTVTNGGLKSIVQVVERMNEPQVLELLTQLDEDDPDLAQRIRENIMTFEDIIKLDESILEVIFDNADPKKIALAVRDCEGESLVKVLNALTIKKKESVNMEIDMAKNAPSNQINDAKKTIVTIAKDLETKGLISLEK